MRKTIITTVIALLFSVSGIAQSIEVTKPGSGDTWYIGKTHEITWSKSGIVNDDLVKIRLYNSAGTVKIWDITNKTDNDGSFHWTIPTSIAPGSYRVRVKTLLKATTDDSSTFKIQKSSQNLYKPLVPKTEKMTKVESLYIIRPVKGETWRLGENRFIKWKSLKIAPKRVSIYIIAKNLGRSGPIWIGRHIANIGYFRWDIPINPKIKRFRPGSYEMVFRGPSGADLTKREFKIDNPTTISLFPSGNKGFKILDKLQYTYVSKGKLGILTVTVKANSNNDFALLGTTDGVDFGTQWMKCWVSCKVPTSHDNKQPVEKIMVSGEFSVSGNGGTQKFYKAPTFPAIIKKNGTYKLSFKFKDHSGVLCFIDVAAKKQGLIKIVLPGDCKTYYFPKLTILLYTKLKSGGTIVTKKVFYLVYTNLTLENSTFTFFWVERSICGVQIKW